MKMFNGPSKISLAILITLVFNIHIFANIGTTLKQKPFVTIWKTDNPGVSANNQIELPGLGRNYLIAWELVSDTNINGRVRGVLTTKITFPRPGVYRLSITGDLLGLKFNKKGDKDKIIMIEEWGGIRWSPDAFVQAYSECRNLDIQTSDIPDLRIVKSFYETFKNCKSLNGPANIGSWDTSNIDDMRYMFHGAEKFNQSVEGWVFPVESNTIEMFSGNTNEAYNLKIKEDYSPQFVTMEPETDYLMQSNGSQKLREFHATEIKFSKELSKLWKQKQPYITVWNTENKGKSDYNQIIIPGSGKNYYIYWESISNSKNNGWAIGNDVTILTFPTPGKYRVEINGDFKSIKFDYLSDSHKLLQLEQWGDVKWSEDAFEGAYKYCINLEISALDIPDLSEVKSFKELFYGCENLTGPYNIGLWNTSNITNMSSMFYEAKKFNQPIGLWNTSNVTNMRSMFSKAIIFNQPIGSWNTSSVSNMAGMFSWAIHFNQPIGSWNTSNVIDMSHMFNRAWCFNQAIGSWNTGKVTNMRSMFGETKLFNQPLNFWNTSQVTDMSEMFQDALMFNQPIGNWNISSLRKVKDIFTSAQCFNQDLSSWNLSRIANESDIFTFTGFFKRKGLEFYLNVASIGRIAEFNTKFRNHFKFANDNMPFVTMWKSDQPGISKNDQILIPSKGEKLFVYWESLEDNTISGDLVGSDAITITFPHAGIYRVAISGDLQSMRFLNSGDKHKLIAIEQWGNTKWVEDAFEGAFWGCRYLDINAIDIPDMRRVTSLANMFKACENLNGPKNIKDWNTENVKDMSGMFSYAKFFNQSLENWVTDRVENMSEMFSEAKSFNQSLNGWNTENVIKMQGMFKLAETFNGEIGDWNTSKVTDMSQMFGSADSFNQPIGGWNTSNVTNMYAMFGSADSFNQAIGDWNTSNVTNMSWTFSNATSFNQAIGKWNTSSVEDMSYMFTHASSFNHPIGSWKTSNVKNMQHLFSHAISFNQPLNMWNTYSVTDMKAMFKMAMSFDQSLANFKLTSIETISKENKSPLHEMLNNSGLDCNNYSTTLIGWANEKDTPKNLALDADLMLFGESALKARELLLNTLNWKISGDILDSANCKN